MYVLSNLDGQERTPPFKSPALLRNTQHLLQPARVQLQQANQNITHQR